MKSPRMFVPALLLFCGASLSPAQPPSPSPRPRISPSPLGSPSPGEMRFRGMDKNNDGKISREEWRGNDKSFSNKDKNGDGVLSGDEVLPAAMSDPGAGSAKPSPTAAPSPSPRT